MQRRTFRSVVLALSLTLGGAACEGRSLDSADAPRSAEASAQSCLPGAFIGCHEDGVVRCEVTGDAVRVERCDGVCSEERRGCVCAGDVEARCSGASLETCVDGAWRSTTCPVGCTDEGAARCLSIVPSNLPADVCSRTLRGRLELDSRLFLDETFACDEIVPQAAGPAICVLMRDEIAVESAVSVEGPFMLALVARTIRMSGGSSITALNGTGYDAGPAIGRPSSLGGGGGGGHAGRGASGGGTSPGEGGEAYGETPSPLLPGARGGKDGWGAGGGALQLVGCERLELADDASISVRGGDAYAPSSGGGGSGGTVVLESADIRLGPAHRIVLDGGGGGTCEGNCPGGLGCGAGGSEPARGGVSAIMVGGGGGGSCGRLFIGVPAGAPPGTPVHGAGSLLTYDLELR